METALQLMINEPRRIWVQFLSCHAGANTRAAVFFNFAYKRKWVREHKSEINREKKGNEEGKLDRKIEMTW